MKRNYATSWVRVAVLGLALVFVASLLAVPWLAKEISGIAGDPIQPEKLDIRPIPVPVPPPPLVRQEPAAAATAVPAHAVAMPLAVPVPTPDLALRPSAPSSISAASNARPARPISSSGISALALAFVILLSWIALCRAPRIHHQPKECAG